MKMGDCKECGIRHPSFYCKVQAKQEKIYKSFFEYFLQFHAIVCDNPQCVCRASTFQDIICDKAIRNSKKYGEYVEEVLSKYE